MEESNRCIFCHARISDSFRQSPVQARPNRSSLIQRQNKAGVMMKKIKSCRRFMSRKISRRMHEGYPQKQAVAITYKEARKKGCPFLKLKKVV